MRWFDITYGIVQKIRISWYLRKLEVVEASTDDGIPFVELRNGPRFFGLHPVLKDKKYYLILPRKTRAVIPFECYKVAMDIAIRYVEGGLKLGGPGKEKFYRVGEGDIIAEMGAYMGYYTMYLAGKAGKNGRVIAIEPMEDNLVYLRKNIQFNQLDNVEIVNKGVWNKNDTLSFKRNPGDTQSASLVMDGGTKEEFTMEVRSLDHILNQCHANHVDFMIIQLNGTEPEAIEGLESVRPKNLAIAARYNVPERNAVKYIVGLLKGRDYEVKVRSQKYIYGNEHGK